MVSSKVGASFEYNNKKYNYRTFDPSTDLAVGYQSYDFHRISWIMCILCTPRPTYRSTYRPTVNRHIGRHIGQASVDMSTDTRPI